MSANGELRVVRACELAERAPDEPRWLIEDLWSAGAVGVLGGAPKCGKTWLSLEMALAVASGRPCLGRFAVPQAGPALVYAAEDAPVAVRDRLAGLARARGVEFARLDVHVILAPSLRLDRPDDLARLRATLEARRPRLLVLDPYVRLQRVDENNATEVSAILAALRELSRVFALALVLVHHARKNPADGTGQALRGSSDFHAWGDSNLYVRRRGPDLVLSIEHRAAPSPPEPFVLGLVAEDDSPRLEVRASPPHAESARPIEQRVIEALRDGNGPRRHDDLRAALKVRNQTLLMTLRELEGRGKVIRLDGGWLWNG